MANVWQSYERMISLVFILTHIVHTHTVYVESVCQNTVIITDWCIVGTAQPVGDGFH